MDRRLFGFVAILALLILVNTVFADDGARRIQSDARGYARHHYTEQHHAHWQSVGDFRTRRHNTSHPILGIDRRISAIQLQGPEPVHLPAADPCHPTSGSRDVARVLRGDPSAGRRTTVPRGHRIHRSPRRRPAPRSEGSGRGGRCQMRSESRVARNHGR